MWAVASILTIRKLSDEVQSALRERAAAAGRSVEAEAREILTAACLPKAQSDFWEGLYQRMLARTPKPFAVDSAELIREGRDARE
jgi:plasmid stability protein